MREHDLDGFITSRLIHCRYVSGFSGSNASVLVTHDSATLFTDSRYGQQAHSQSPHCQIIIERNVVVAAVQQARINGLRKIGFESVHVSVNDFKHLNDIANGFNIELVACVDVIEDLRKVKSAEEIQAIEKACDITDLAWAQLLDEGVLGKTEVELAGRLEMLFRVHGAEDRAFETIVATGPHSAIPHHEPSLRTVVHGDFLKIDCGARFEGYHADMTRTVVVGQAADWQKEIYAVVLDAQTTARNAVKPGVDSFIMDSVARSIVTDAGYGPQFLHQLGHGVGLEIHERPFLGRQDGILAPCMPITIEPGIYLEGRGGVRIEDTLVVVEAGHRNLTKSPRELLEV
jgi:Xaa-Pro dipeptidase